MIALTLSFALLYSCTKLGETDTASVADTIETESSTKPLIKGLGADGPDPELKEKLMRFGQFVGDWETESEWFLPDGSTPRGKGEIHFGWILSEITPNSFHWRSVESHDNEKTWLLTHRIVARRISLDE